MESRDDVKKFLLKLIAEELEIDSETLSEEMSLRDDLEIKSLEVVSIIADLEDHYKIAVEDEEILELTTIEDLINKLLKRITSAA